MKEPTRRGNILDLVITNEQGLMGDVCLEAGLASSDHEMVRWRIYVGLERREEKGESLDYRRADFEGMRRADWCGLGEPTEWGY